MITRPVYNVEIRRCHHSQHDQLRDHRPTGHPRVVTNSAGTAIWSWAYQGNPFGEQQSSSATGYVLNLRYPGRYFDVETGLYYNLNRYYDLWQRCFGLFVAGPRNRNDHRRKRD